MRLNLRSALSSFATAALIAVSMNAAAAETLTKEDYVNFAGAVERDRGSVVRDYLAKGISPNAIVHDGDPALVRAVRMDNEDIVKILLATKEIDVNQLSRYNETALMLAAFKGNKDLVNTFLERGAKVNGAPNWTALHYAATNGHDDIVKLLLAKGAQVNARTKGGVTPLYMAARKPSREAVMTLLRAGAYRDICNSEGASPAKAAADAGDAELSKYLAIEKCVNPDNLLKALPKSK